ncbi:hypothetical protein C8J55DRAFT_486789 [Lentinula edodes]|uniref:Uncharacterized protein n=1 Tax=Lentinula lateritia TaxID=40482 RepID=A0A9W9ASS6_9AGAR|nr:hypothetical protein C8J55DRAFT_486789 [Lentinula edodes]
MNSNQPDVPAFIRKPPYDRIELRSSIITKPVSADRRILSSPGASRTPRSTVRVSPYRYCRPLSPDPSFQPASLTALDTSNDIPPTPVTQSENLPMLNPTISQPRIVTARITTSDASNESRPQELLAHDDSGDEFETEDKIPKPSGEVGQPTRGGYNLRIKLGWADDRFDDVEKFINEIVGRKLDATQTFDQQLLSDIKELGDIAVRRYPFLNEYRGNWVVHDFVKCNLKHRKRILAKPAAGLRKGKK